MFFSYSNSNIEFSDTQYNVQNTVKALKKLKNKIKITASLNQIKLFVGTWPQFSNFTCFLFLTKVFEL